jgi:hypothetical protein
MLLFALASFIQVCLLCALVPGLTFRLAMTWSVFLLLLRFVLAACRYSPCSCRCNLSWRGGPGFAVFFFSLLKARVLDISSTVESQCA